MLKMYILYDLIKESKYFNAFGIELNKPLAMTKKDHEYF